MIINHNMSAAFANRSLGLRTGEMGGSIEKLSSGLKINRAGDDASGLAVSENMRSQIRGLQKASQNVQDARSFIQATEGYLDETTSVLQRMRELSIQAGNGIYSSNDRKLVQIEIDQLVAEVDRIAAQSQFNGMNILTGRFQSVEEGGTGPISFHIGANVDQTIATKISATTSDALGLRGAGEQVQAINIDNPEAANSAIARLDQALSIVTEQRSELGAMQNRLSYLKGGLDIGAENLQTAESRIRDTDIASEVTKFVRAQILTQTSTAMLAQANTVPQSVLQLLQ